MLKEEVMMVKMILKKLLKENDKKVIKNLKEVIKKM